MINSVEPLLDEIQWRSPQIAQSMGGIQTNTVLPYFSESPFFDKTSNNAILANQALYNQNMFHLIQTREAFEGRLKSMAGLEFMVIGDPSDKGQKPEHNGVWVIRKQYRRKRPGVDDEITPLTSYFVIGEHIYMAPSLADVISSRMLSTVTSLTSFFTAASSLPLFSPSQGYSSLGSTSKPAPSTAQISRQPSREGTPTPMTRGATPPTQATQDSFKSTSTSTGTNKSQSSNATVNSTAILADSFGLSIRYGSEYMDENPLVGEPGSFILRKTRDAQSQAQQVQEQQSQQSQQSQQQQQQQVNSKTAQAAKVASPPPPAMINTNIPPLAPARKGSKGGEKTPITPGGKDKKRKKKATTTTPK